MVPVQQVSVPAMLNESSVEKTSGSDGTAVRTGSHAVAQVLGFWKRFPSFRLWEGWLEIAGVEELKGNSLVPKGLVGSGWKGIDWEVCLRLLLHRKMGGSALVRTR